MQCNTTNAILLASRLLPINIKPFQHQHQMDFRNSCLPNRFDLLSPLSRPFKFDKGVAVSFSSRSLQPFKSYWQIASFPAEPKLAKQKQPLYAIGGKVSSIQASNRKRSS